MRIINIGNANIMLRRLYALQCVVMKYIIFSQACTWDGCRMEQSKCAYRYIHRYRTVKVSLFFFFSILTPFIIVHIHFLEGRYFV